MGRDGGCAPRGQVEMTWGWSVPEGRKGGKSEGFICCPNL